MRNGFLGLLILMLLTLPLGALAQEETPEPPEDDPAVLAATWLVGQQEENGSFNDDDFGVTVLALMALASVEQPNPAAMTWVENYVVDQAEELSLGSVSAALLAVTMNGVDPEVFANGILPEAHNERISIITMEETSQFDLCWALVAVPTVDRDYPGAALAGLLLLQNEDGSFGSSDTGSDPFLTAICLQSLIAAGETASVERALEYFRANQTEEGGWRAVGEDQADGFTSGFVLMALNAAGENLEAWNDPMGALMQFRDEQTGAFFRTEEERGDESLSIGATSLAIMALQRRTLLDAPGAEPEIVINPEGEDGPELDPAWLALAGGLQIAELDTADDFFITTMNPDTEEEIFGIQLINWAATNNYTRFLITDHLRADILLWMGFYDPAIWEQISEDVLRLLPNHVLILLPEQVQERITAEPTAEPTEESTSEPTEAPED